MVEPVLVAGQRDAEVGHAIAIAIDLGGQEGRFVRLVVAQGQFSRVLREAADQLEALVSGDCRVGGDGRQVDDIFLGQIGGEVASGGGGIAETGIESLRPA